MAKNNDKVSELTEHEFEKLIQKDVALVDFTASWCMPCVMMGPIIDELSEKFKGKIDFGKVNIEDNQELAKKYQVSSIPNFILFKKGEIAEQFVGAMSVEDFEDKLNKLIL